MKLSEMATAPTLTKMNSITESRFGFKLDYESITLSKATAMRNKIMEAVNNIRRSSQIHTAEKNPKYLEMLIVFEGLSRWIDAHNTQQLTEGELGTAEAILAAKDMVDTAQDMIEKLGKMQNEQLPALVDTVRDQIGSEQADAFKNTVSQTLATLAQQVSQSREQLDAAARALTGEAAPADMAVGDEIPGADMGAEIPGEEPADGFDGVDAAAGGSEQLGRGRR